MSNQAVVTTIKTQSEFEQFDKILSEFYDKFFAESKDWWNAFPQGSVVIKIDDTIVGGLTLYPIEETIFEAFKNGKVKEDKLTIDHTNRNNWYIGDYILVKEHRNAFNLMTLVSGALDHWYSFQSGHYPIQVICTPITKNGEKGARGLKLKPYAFNDTEELPIYFRKIHSKASLRHYIYSVKSRTVYVRIKYWFKSFLIIKRVVSLNKNYPFIGAIKTNSYLK